MPRLGDLTVQYVTTEEGDKTAVVVPIKEFEALMEYLDELVEDLEDLATIAERRDEPALTHEQVLAELRQDGLLGFLVRQSTAAKGGMGARPQMIPRCP